MYRAIRAVRPPFSASTAVPCARNSASSESPSKALLTPVRRALLSVSDKTGIVEFARELKERGIELLSTGGTAKLLVRHGVSVKEVAEHTGFPEIMGGRVKTLHPRIHGGLLGRRGLDEEVMRRYAIEPIDC